MSHLGANKLVISIALAFMLVSSTFSMSFNGLGSSFASLDLSQPIDALSSLFLSDLGRIFTLSQQRTQVLAVSADETVIEANGSVTRLLSYPVLQFQGETVSEISQTITWNTDGSMDVSDNRGNHYTLTIQLDNGSTFKLLESPSKVIQQVVAGNGSQYQVIWEEVSTGQGSEKSFKFTILGTSPQPSKIVLEVSSDKNVVSDEKRFIISESVAVSEPLESVNPNGNASDVAKGIVNDTADAELALPRSATENAVGIGLDWSDAIEQGHRVEFIPSRSEIEISVSGTFYIDPVTVATTSAILSPGGSDYYEGERRLVGVGDKLFAFFYDGSNIVYKISTDEGNTWGSTVSLGTGILNSENYRWTIAVTKYNNIDRIIVFYWKQNNNKTNFYSITGSITSTSETWASPVLLFNVNNHSACNSGTCAAAVAANSTTGDVYAAFRYLKSNSVSYLYRIFKSADAGSTWTSSLAETSSGSSTRIEMGLTDLASGKMLFVYARYSSSEFRYRVFDGAGWGAETLTSGAGMQTNTIKQISIDSDRTNTPYVAYLTGGISGTLKVARWTNAGTPTFETADNTLSHSLPGITMTSNSTASIVRVYSISNSKIYETKKDGTWKAPVNPFGTAFTNPDQLTAAMSYDAGLWVEGTNIRFSRNTPIISWSPSSLTIDAKPGAPVQLNFTSSDPIPSASVIVSSEISNYVFVQNNTLTNIPAQQAQQVNMNLLIPPDATSGWHNGTISLQAFSTLLSEPFILNIFVPSITKTSVTTNGGTIDYIATPSYSPYFSNTKDISIYFTFDNGTKKLVEISYDTLYNTTAGPSGSSGALMTLGTLLSPFTAAGDYFASSNIWMWTFNEAYAQNVPESECTIWSERYDYRTYSTEIPSTIAVASQTLNVDSGHPLVIRFDIRWEEVDNGHIDPLSLDWVHESWNNDTIDNMFNNIITSDKKVILILSTHRPPDAIKPFGTGLLGYHAQFMPRFQDDADSFIRHVITYIQSKPGWIERVQMWQIDNEPNLHPMSGITLLQGKKISFIDWKVTADAFNMWLSSVKSLDPTRTTTVNMYQANKHPELPVAIFSDRIIAPFENLLLADATIGQQVATNLNIMGFDIYADAWLPLQGSSPDMIKVYKDALNQVKHQLQMAEGSPINFAGRWGLLELPGGDKGDPYTYTPSASDVGQLINIAKTHIANKPPAVIAFFQLRATNAQPPLSLVYDHNYALIQHNANGNGTVLSAYKDQIKQNVVQNCPEILGTNSISGYKFNDLNGNGLDDNEPKLANWNITLFKSGVKVVSVLTNTTGFYNFTSLSSGTYTITEQLQSGWTNTTRTTIGPIDLTGSNMKSVNNKFGNVAVATTIYNVTVQDNGRAICGNINCDKFDGEEITPSSQLVGVFFDKIQIYMRCNDNQVGDSCPGLVGTAYLGIWDGTVAPTAGNYKKLITAVDPTSLSFVTTQYTYAFDGYTFAAGDVIGLYYDHDSCNSSGCWVSLRFSIGDQFDGTSTRVSHYYNGGCCAPHWVDEPTYDITMTLINTGQPPVGGLVSGYKYKDANGNGARDTGEQGLLGWTILLKNAASGALLETTTTNANGFYKFSGLAAGTYRVEEVQKQGYTQTAPTGGFFERVVQSGTNSTGNEFGNMPLAITIYNVTVQNNGRSVSGDTVNHAQFDGMEVTPTSALVGKSFNKMDIWMRRISDGSGTVYLGIWDSTTAPTVANAKKIITSFDFLSLQFDPTLHSYSFSTWTFSANEAIGMYYAGVGEASIRFSTSDQFDGTNTRETWYRGGSFNSWVDEPNNDVTMTLINIGGI